nr:MAK10-like protein [Tanacetum cinerariifolium]
MSIACDFVRAVDIARLRFRYSSFPCVPRDCLFLREVSLPLKALDAFCNKFHIPEEVHPVLPDQNDKMHERPDGKIGLYTSKSQLFVIGVARAMLWDHTNCEPLLLETTIDSTVLLLLVALDHVESELDASVERLFDEGGSGNQTEQGDSAGGGKDADIQPVIEAVDTVVEDVALVQPKRQRKRKSVVVNVGEASLPPKKLREDQGTLSETSIGGKSVSAVKRLLARAVLNAKVDVAAVPTLPFMTTCISTTPEREGGDHIDSVARLNLCAIGVPLRFVISSESSHHSGTNVAEAEVNSLVKSSVRIMTTVTTITSTVDPASVVKEKLVGPSSFCDGSSSAGGTDPTTGGFSDLTCSDFLVGGICIVVDPDVDLQKIYVPQWSVTNGSRLDNGRVCREMINEFAPFKFFVSVRRMKHDQLFTEFNVGTARQMALSVEVRMCDEYNVKERRRLKSVVEKQVELLKERNGMITSVTELIDLNALITSVKSQNDNLVDRAHELEISSSGLQEKVTVYANCMDQLEKFQDDRMKVVNDKFDKLYTNFVEPFI